jgi:hypothetical protein
MRSLAAMALLAVACGVPTSPCPADGSCHFTETSTYAEFNPIRTMDVLVVMDDSASMARRQGVLVARLAPLLEWYPGGLPEVRVRVISSSVPSTGLAAFPGCAAGAAEPRSCAPPASGYLEATNLCGAHRNYSGSFAEAFSCFARVGTGGCGWEQPLAAARAALEGDPQDGSRFLRKDALFALVIITDEDDCSVPAQTTLFGDPTALPDDPALAYRCHQAGVRCAGQRLSDVATGVELSDCAPAVDGGGLNPIGDYARFFLGLKPRPEMVMASVLAAAPAHYGLISGAQPTLRPACSDEAGAALPAVRLRGFVDALGPQGRFTDLCGPVDSLGSVLDLAAQRPERSSDPLCLPADVIDGDPARPGIQPLCAATESSLDGAPDRVIPSCDSGAAPPCWRPRPLGFCLAAEVDRGGCRVGGTILRLSCATGAPSPAASPP